MKHRDEKVYSSVAASIVRNPGYYTQEKLSKLYNVSRGTIKRVLDYYDLHSLLKTNGSGFLMRTKVVAPETSEPLSIESRCLRCGGRVDVDRDEFGWYMHCLLCGHIVDLAGIKEPTRVLVPLGKV